MPGARAASWGQRGMISQDGNLLKQMMATVAQLNKYTQKPSAAHFKCVLHTLCEVCPNDTAKKIHTKAWLLVDAPAPVWGKIPWGHPQMCNCIILHSCHAVTCMLILIFIGMWLCSFSLKTCVEGLAEWEVLQQGLGVLWHCGLPGRRHDSATEEASPEKEKVLGGRVKGVLKRPQAGATLFRLKKQGRRVEGAGTELCPSHAVYQLRDHCPAFMEERMQLSAHQQRSPQRVAGTWLGFRGQLLIEEWMV